LEGLDITVRKLNQVADENRAFRIDAQYFSRAAIATEQTLKSGRWETLGHGSSRIESFGAYALTNRIRYVEEGVPFLRCLNIKGGFANLAGSLFITPEAHELLSKSAVEPGMVLLTMSGSVGEAAVAQPNWPYPINSNQDIAKITPRDGLNPYFLTAFLNSRYGRTQAERLPVGSVQQHIFLWMLEELVAVRRFSDALESAVARAVEDAYRSRDRSKSSLSEAESVLAAALGLGGWQPPEPLTYTCRAAAAFHAGRLDAEFFDPGKAEIVKRVERRGAQPLGEFVEVGTGFPWDSNYFLEDRASVGEPFVRIRDCKPGTLAPEDLDRLDASYAEAQGQMRAKAGDLVIGMDGLKWFYASLLTGPCYINQRVAHLRTPAHAAVDAEFLLVFLNSMLGQRQLLRVMTVAHTVGHITLNDIRNVLVPKIAQDTRTAIAAKARQAHAAFIRARALLAAARRAVEISIEDSEAAALKHLKEA
jgi:hypothetical protein